MTEHVLVVPAAALHEAGLFQGFSDRVTHYLHHLLEPGRLRYHPRDLAEVDPSLKQLIPYVVLRHAGQVFQYRRSGGGERRLRSLCSIGIGGHICSADGGVGADAYRAGLLRELHEEVELPAGWSERCIGLINDDRTPVGQVHLGVVHLVDLPSPQVRSREAGLSDTGFAPLAQLRRDRDRFETWSQLLLDGPWLDQ